MNTQEAICNSPATQLPQLHVNNEASEGISHPFGKVLRVNAPEHVAVFLGGGCQDLFSGAFRAFCAKKHPRGTSAVAPATQPPQMHAHSQASEGIPLPFGRYSGDCSRLFLGGATKFVFAVQWKTTSSCLFTTSETTEHLKKTVKRIEGAVTGSLQELVRGK